MHLLCKNLNVNYLNEIIKSDNSVKSYINTEEYILKQKSGLEDIDKGQINNAINLYDLNNENSYGQNVVEPQDSMFLIRKSMYESLNNPTLCKFINYGYFPDKYVFQDDPIYKITIQCLNDSIFKLQREYVNGMHYPLNNLPQERFEFYEKYKYHVDGTAFEQLIVDSIIETNRKYDKHIPLRIPHKVMQENTHQFPQLIGDTIYINPFMSKLRVGKFTFDKE